MAVSLKGYAFNDAGDAVSATVEAVGRGAGGTHTTTSNPTTGAWAFASLPDDIYDVAVELGGKVVRFMGDCKIQLDAFVSAAGATPIADGSITAAKLAPDAVTAPAIAAGAVGTTELALASVTSVKIANLAVGSAQLADGSVTAPKLAANAVGTSAIQDGSVTQAKLASGAGGGGSGVTDNSVYTNAIQNLAVTTGKIAAGAVGTTQLAGGAVTTAKLALLSVTTNSLGDASVTTAKLATDAVTGSKIVAGTISADKLAAGVLSIDNTTASDTTSADYPITNSASAVISGLGATVVGVTGGAAHLVMATFAIFNHDASEWSFGVKFDFESAFRYQSVPANRSVVVTLTAIRVVTVNETINVHVQSGCPNADVPAGASLVTARMN